MTLTSWTAPVRRAMAGACAAAALVTPPAHAAPRFDLVSRHGPTSVPAGYDVAAVSGNGRWVAYVVRPGGDLADGVDVSTGSETELWVKDLATGTETKVATGMCCGDALTFSRDGRWLVFDDDKPVVAGDTNNATDVHVYDTRLRRLTRVTDVRGRQLEKGAFAGVVTADGRTVVFTSYSDVLAKRGQQAPPCAVYKYSFATRRTTPVLVAGQPVCAFTGEIAVNADGRYVALVSMEPLDRADGIASQDVYRIDTVRGTATLVSEPRVNQNTEEHSADPAIDGSGRLVAWVVFGAGGSLGPTKKVMLRDVTSGRLVPVHTGLLGDATPMTDEPALSENGRWFSFTETNGNVLLAEQADAHNVYLRDLTKGVATATRIETAGSCAHASCYHPASSGAVLSGDGKVVAYLTNVAHADGDDDSNFDVYVYRQ